MNTTKHTPGPWHSYPEHESSSFQGYAVESEAGQIIATTGTTNEDASNAALIAASPDLLELAEAFVSYLEDDSRSERRRAACLEEARAAIAKAEGRS